MTFSVMVNLHHSIIEDLQNCIAFLVSVAFLSFNPGLTCYCWAVEGGRDVHFQFWLQHSPGITLKSPPKIQSFNAGHTCYCWLVEGRRGGMYISLQYWLQHSWMITGITYKSPLKIKNCNVGHTCYCWAVEGGRDVHFQLCGLCQASHHSLKDVTQRFLGFCQKTRTMDAR